MYYVYIIRNETGKHYIGYTKDIENRVQEHNSGKTKSLRGKGPFELVYKESFNTRIEAAGRERQIKKYKGGEAFKRLIDVPL